MSKPKKTPKRIVVDLTKKPRKRTVPNTAYSKDNPSPFAWKPGESGNSAGKKRNETRLLSRACNVYLADRAPSEVSKALGLPSTASWAQCLARRLMNLAVRGEQWAYDQLARLTEPMRARLDVYGNSFDSEDAETPPLMRIAFIRSDGNGNVCQDDLTAFPDLAKTIEGEVAKPALPTPTERGQEGRSL
jgi:hypothetical protein